MVEIKEMLSASASICTIIQILVPLYVCYTYYKNKSTGMTSSLPFVLGLLSSSLWLTYGMYLHEPSLVYVNGIGVYFHIVYVGFFLTYCQNKARVLRQLAYVAPILALTLIYCYFETDESIVVFRVGMLCCIITCCFFAAPLGQLAYVIRVRSTNSLPFPVIVMTLITSSQWVIYGIIVKDAFMIIPNVIGTILSIAQLYVFHIYPPSGSEANF